MVRVIKDAENITQAKTNELEDKLWALKGKHDEFEAKVTRLEGNVAQANSEGRLAWEELTRATSQKAQKGNMEHDVPSFRPSLWR